MSAPSTNTTEPEMDDDLIRDHIAGSDGNLREMAEHLSPAELARAEQLMNQSSNSES